MYTIIKKIWKSIQMHIQVEEVAAAMSYGQNFPKEVGALITSFGLR